MRFKRGEFSVKDYALSGRPSTSQNAEQKVKKYHPFTTYGTEEIDVIESSWLRILTGNLQISSVVTKFALRLPNQTHKVD